MRNANLERAIKAHSKARDAERIADKKNLEHPRARTQLPIPELEHPNRHYNYFFQSHADIDEAVRTYIAKCRKRGSWGYWRAENPPPEFHQQPFTRETLKLYRARVKQLHASLAEIIEANNVANETLGANAASAAAIAAGELERRTWAGLVDVVKTDADIARFLRYTHSLTNKELRLVINNPHSSPSAYWIGRSETALNVVVRILAARATKTARRK